jgi:hypothetical protein
MHHNVGILRGIEVVPPSGTTTQNVTITNLYGTTVWSDILTGTDYIGVEIPLRGIYTVALSGATSNGANTVRFWMEKT